MAVRIVSTLVAALVLATPAQAQRCDAPAGTGAVDQYCEVVPGDRGDRDPGPGGGPTIDEPTAAGLAGQGEDGAALARSLGRDPAGLEPRTPKNKDSDAVTLPDVPSSNPFSSVTRAIGGDATLGSVFFWALFGIVLAMLGWAWVAYRRDSTSA